MSRNKEMVKTLLDIKCNIQNNKRMLSVDIKLPSNQKDDAQKVKEYVHERIGNVRRVAL